MSLDMTSAVSHWWCFDLPICGPQAARWVDGHASSFTNLISPGQSPLGQNQPSPGLRFTFRRNYVCASQSLRRSAPNSDRIFLAHISCKIRQHLSCSQGRGTSVASAGGCGRAGLPGGFEAAAQVAIDAFSGTCASGRS